MAIYLGKDKVSISGYAKDHSIEDAIVSRSFSGEYENNRILTVGDYAFYQCEGITKFSSNSITSIGTYAFYYCRYMKEFYAPNLKDLSKASSFSLCSSLIEINIDNVTGVIGSRVFDSCPALNTCYIKKATSISSYCFNADTCLATLVLNKGSVISLSNTNALTGTAITKCYGYIYVPRAVLATYKGATNWVTYKNQFRAIEDWTVDGTLTGKLNIGGLYKKGEYVNEKAIDESGAIVTNSGYCYTNNIEINPNKSYFISGVPRDTTRPIRIHAYDENNNWIKMDASFTVTTTAASDFTYTPSTNNIKYIKITMPSLKKYGESSFSIKEVS